MAQKPDLLDATNDKENSTVKSNTMIKAYEPYKPNKSNAEKSVIKDIRDTMKKVKQNKKARYLRELRKDWPTMYGEKGQFPNLIDELLAELPEAERLADTDEPLDEAMGIFDLFENPWGFERNNDDESARPNNTFDEPTAKQKNKRSQAVTQPLESLFEDSYTKFFTIPAGIGTVDDDLLCISS